MGDKVVFVEGRTRFGEGSGKFTVFGVSLHVRMHGKNER